MSKQAEPGQREYALGRIFDLPTRDQLFVYREIRDLLASRIRETARDRSVEERAAAIDALAAVAQHLELDARAPTPSEFDAAARALGLNWNRGRVQRAWDKWRFAKETYLGQHVLARRSERLGQTDVRRRYLPPVDCVRLWLRTKPESRSTNRYIEWASAHNEACGPEDVLVVIHTGSITRPLQMTWPDAVSFAAGEISESEARPIRRQPRDRYCRGPHDLVSRADVLEMLKGTEYTVGRAVALTTFPRSVVALGRNRFWLRADVEAYAKGEPFVARRENELRHVYLTAMEVAGLTGFSRVKVSAGKGGLPPRAVRMGSVDLWLRDEIDEWLREKGGPRTAAAHV